jgi:hypothetical protein
VCVCVCVRAPARQKQRALRPCWPHLTRVLSPLASLISLDLMQTLRPVDLVHFEATVLHRVVPRKRNLS